MSAATEIMIDRIAWRMSGAGFSQEISGVDVTTGYYARAPYFRLNVDELLADAKGVFY